MKRRGFIVVLAGAAAWPLAALAQQPERMRRVGVLRFSPKNDPFTQTIVTAFAQALERLGWFEGENIRIDYRFAAGDPPLFKTYAAELVALAPDAILASTTPGGAGTYAHDTDHFRTGCRSRRAGMGSQSRAARRQPHGVYLLGRAPNGEMAPIAEGGCTSCHAGRCHLQSGHRALRPIS